MKKLLIALTIILGSLPSFNAQTYEYKTITSVESIIPSGMGRSRIIDTSEKRNYEDFTSGRTDGKRKKMKETNLKDQRFVLRTLKKLNY